MTPQISLRQSTQADAALFYAIVDQTMRGHIVATWGAWDEERVRGESVEDSAYSNSRIVQVEGQDAGVLRVDEEPTHLQVHQLYLLPPYQKRGIGTQLIGLLSERSIVSGKPVRLRVLRVNPAKLFYEKLGFKVTEENHEFFCMERAA